MAESLKTRLGSLELKNPILSASGTFGYGQEVESFVDPSIYGGIVGKSISLEPRKGNPLPRTWETASGMLNSIGLQNPGIDAFISDPAYLPRMSAYDTRIVVNLVGDTIDEYVEMARRLDAESAVDALELNISCPNCPLGGMEFGVEAEATRRLVEAVRENFSRAIIAKLTPNVTDVIPIAQAAASGGADALSLVNTYVGMAVEWRQRRPRLGGITGGLSGPAIKPLALRLVWLVAQNCDVPVIGIGGIKNTDDVLEFIVAGASAVQIGTVQFVRPRVAVDMLDGIKVALEETGAGSIADLVGTLETSGEAITVRQAGSEKEVEDAAETS
ncbi:MAG: dihydroorotate dehydrogenase [Planctomycetota bacterium]|nr:dihydroorotate dehydrogenase [Planctomycetota bacterium]